MDSYPSDEILLDTAKQQLGLHPSTASALVPKCYLEELRTHMMLYPEDINFLAMLEPKRGFGQVTCLETGCNNIGIPLVRRVKVMDGGKKDGLGSLSAYRFHIETHPTHRATRLARLKNGPNIGAPIDNLYPSSSTPIQAKVERPFPSLLGRLDSASVSSAMTSDRKLHSSGLKRVPTRPVVKSESLDLPISAYPTNVESNRRHSGLTRILKPELTESNIPVIPRKRLSDAMTDDKPVTPDSSFSKKMKFELPKTPLAQINRNTSSSESVVAATSPPAISVEEARVLIQEVQMKIFTVQASYDRLRWKRKKSKADVTRMNNYSSELALLKDQKEIYNQAIPAMSPVKRTSSRQLSNTAIPVKGEPSLTNSAMFPSDERKPIVQTIQQIASGSGVRLPGRLPVLNDTDDEEDEDENAVDPMAVLRRIGPAIPAITPIAGYDHHDENGDFHGRGRDLFQGPQAKADDIDKFLIEAGNAEAFDGNASVDKALVKLGLQAQFQLLPGMEVALMPHQTIGVAWMLDKEGSSLKGGCLGDDMGLGKTIQMIALLVKNPSKDLICKTNLIIAPTAILGQWQEQIESKTNNDLKCLIYHGSNKPRKKADLLKYDIVLTTYSTMALEWPDFEMEQKAKEKAKRKKNSVVDFIDTDSDSDVGSRTKRRHRKKEAGLLFQVDWYRIVLDEAQAIRNRRTRASRAVTDLRAVYRWCLTGTPIINGLVDVYGYLRFLKIRPWYDFMEFQSHIGSLERKNPELAVTRLQAIILTFLLRRMKDTMLDGKRLIELPPKNVSLIKLEFSEEEREIYKMIEARTQANFNRYLRAGTVLKNYSQVLVLLLRLRQICSHPSLIQEGSDAFIEPDENDEIKPEIRNELARARRLVSPEFVSKMKQKFKEQTLRRIELEKESADAAVEDEECPICFDVFTDAIITPCAHAFCRECIDNVLIAPHTEDAVGPHKYKVNERPCPSCRSAICAEKLFLRAAFEPTDAELSSQNDDDNDVEITDVDVVKGKGKAKSKRPSRRLHMLNSDDVMNSDDNKSEPEDNGNDDMSDFIVQSGDDEGAKDVYSAPNNRLRKRRVVVIDSEDEIEDPPEEREVIFGKKRQMSKEQIKLMPKFLPSTKMKCMMENITKLATERPDEKILVISQWTGCLSLVSNYLAEAGIFHVKFQGDMVRSKRDQAVRVFMAKDKAKIMLMSLKCGGVGLNLTRANNVISLDLGWSQAIEAQAFDRVHRLGQTRDVVVKRLVISDTVEDRVLAMQERKQSLADGSLGEGQGKKIGRLSVRELANLFGLDHRGRVLAKD